MIERVLNEIDAEISRLQQARTLLATMDSGTAKLKTTGARTNADNTKKRGKRTMSPEGRERVRQAQIKRWAKTKKAAKG